MIGLLLIAAVIVIVLCAYWPKSEQEEPRDATAQEWIEAEERGEVTILDDHGTDHPTVEFRRRR
ncbi:hypothetical protein KSD_39190 [Ktedonobacter sp. SOSP1-85]|uniref:hypothetical protein n=1 Tax=Ktedonobacter sp. SOSP1-85 TaxID=2778367 RepID=UPI0019154E0F|nr:hypothetical protein [Ktedonobacter sp. SOSP1-85]GHO76148.1 hypothetical protein KSD_39190 [Ktedonobacter sp. SOSP1-85]